MEQPSYYSILTANVRYDKELKANEKLLFSEITALSNRNGYCHATNKYFAQLYDKNSSTISDWINHLKQRGYLKVVMVKDGKQIKERRLFPISNPIRENPNTPSEKTVGGYPEKAEYPIQKNPKENITSINTTSTNTTSTNKSLVDAQHSIHDVFTLWQNNWGFPNGIAQQDLTEWVNEFGGDLVYYVIETALRRNVKSSGADSYLRVTLSAYKKQGINTVKKAVQEAEQHQQQMSREYQQKSGSRKRQPINEGLPEWFKKQQEEQPNKQHYERIDDSGDPMPHD
ncbi:helix-turn-helix domain-containing protein [Limosilactobacillus reuteri]|uniref:helix-turn-helix domain-containing protein n=1 Tax=Limosilactobacillus reuteri TaxID=1598 RepID=UPI001E517899|nr:helix-turn-helix domain-containing protein [Limosilactobacillus reuteri]MCC4383579.1 helix-turn-helix domain-containing protein [Limosilactobacillus reuteri]MCC4420338.1 helix-turn-helix domain-containing protein [Limosilactobacillus reuteri]MCC4421793.1 helix-turn-helix domain-containing protein [Limosilactobacillus reuteri]